MTSRVRSQVRSVSIAQYGQISKLIFLLQIHLFDADLDGESDGKIRFSLRSIANSRDVKP